MSASLPSLSLISDLKQEMVKGGLVTKLELKSAEEEANLTNASIGRVLLNKGYTSLDALLSFIEERLHIPYVNLDEYTLDERVIRRLPPTVAVNFRAIPLFEIEGVLTLAMADPVDIMSLDWVTHLVKCPVEVVIASESSILSAIYRWYASDEARKTLIAELVSQVEQTPSEISSTLMSGADQSPAILNEEIDGTLTDNLVNHYLVQALLEHASDIHFEPRKTCMTVRFRIDGVLYQRARLPLEAVSRITVRIKVLAGIDISEKRLPQDGRMGMVIMDHDIDVRLSTFPTIHGEKLVLRLLDKTSQAFTLSALGFGEETAKLEELVNAPTGMLLVTGPTGSGKTTTLYSMLNCLNKSEKNIMTIEDPIEYCNDGIMQSQVQLKTGLTFAKALRSILRQDPDVIYVGEIRDLETAEIAINAALTGHLVLSSMHTNDAASAVTRLMDLGVAPYLISSVLLAVVAQRLVRLNCDRCREPEVIDPSILQQFGVAGDEVFYKGVGCEYCSGTGYRGRTAVSEIFQVNSEMRSRILPAVTTENLRAHAIKEGMTPLLESAVACARKGDIALPEVYRTIMS